MDLLRSAYRSLLLHCIEIKKQASLFPEDLNSISDIPYFSSERMMSVSLHEIGANLEIIESHTYTGAWNESAVYYKDIWKLEKLKCVILQTLEEVEVTLDKVRALLIKCDEAGIELSANTNVCELESLKSTIRSLKSLDVLFPYSNVNLARTYVSDEEILSLPVTVRKLNLGNTHTKLSGLLALSRFVRLEDIDLMGIQLSDASGWVSVLQSLPATVRKINLWCTDIDASGLLELSRFTSLDEIDLQTVYFPDSIGWVSVILSLPVTVKKIKLGFTKVDASGLCKLSRLVDLEEIDLTRLWLSNPGDWTSVMQSMPITVKKINLHHTNIDVSALRKLSRFKSLEEIDLKSSRLSDPSDWVSVMQGLPSTVWKIDLTSTNIDASGLCALSRLTSLEEIVLNSVKLANREGWVSMIQGLPVTMRRIYLAETDIDATVLCELSRLARLEEIDLKYVKLTNPDDWVLVIQSLPLTVKKIDLRDTNIEASGLLE